MKTNNYFLHIILTMLLCFAGTKTYAYDIAVENADGVTIYYNYINDGTELEVKKGDIRYTGAVNIPSEVTYMNRTRNVTSIGDNAFSGCDGLTSITIPNSVTSIGNLAFYSCPDLRKVIVNDIAAWCGITFRGGESNPLSNAHHLYSDENTEITNLVIPNSVTSIGHLAFYGCYGFTSVTIPNSVTSIGSVAFSYCKSLTSITIPNSVTSIGNNAFYGCSSLTSVTFGNSVTSIEDYVFYGCSSLTSVTFGNSVTSIGDYAFYGCSSLTSVTIPNSVTSIGEYAYLYCSGLTSVTIGNSVTSIGNDAFSNCTGITSVISKMKNPCTISSNCFPQDVFYNVTLNVPYGTTDIYKSTYYWKKFVYIEEGEPSGGSSEPETCAKPTIGYSNGKLSFNSTTEGATCYYSITDTDIKAGSGDEVNLTVTYNVSVYASKVGYNNSETATATLCWIDTTPTTEGITNGVTQIPANAVLIQAHDGFICISGIDESKQIAIYQTDGKQVATAKAYNGSASVATNISKGTPVIVKIGEKAVKVVMQ